MTATCLSFLVLLPCCHMLLPILTCRGGSTDSAGASDSTKSLSDGDSKVCILLQDLQADLHSIMRLEKRSAEYQLAVYMGSGSQYVKHRDALPDDGADPNQRRVGQITCSALAIAYAPSVVQQLHQHSNKCFSSQTSCISIQTKPVIATA